MTSGQENLLAFGLVVVAAAAAWGWFSDKSTKLKQSNENALLRLALKEQEAILDKRRSELDRREEFVAKLRNQFSQGYIAGRKWLAEFVAEADRALDESIVDELQTKRRPAYKAAEEVSLARAERRAFKERAKYLEYQLQTYHEYFPVLEEYEEPILDEGIALVPNGANLDALADADPVLRYVPSSDYDKMPSAVRNQLALDRYISGKLSPQAIGRLYERFIGHLYEQQGWAVEYHGIIEGLEDLGRDLICVGDGEIHVVQVKCWSQSKTIHEKHIFQLFGTTQLLLLNRRKNGQPKLKVTPRFVTTTSLSPVARDAAEWLKVSVDEEWELDKAYPMIKCNVNQRTGDKIYHLPFDQQYDRTKISHELGECYVRTAEEAEERGFRRAFRYKGAGDA
jgi:hypothetical protein